MGKQIEKEDIFTPECIEFFDKIKREVELIEAIELLKSCDPDVLRNKTLEIKGTSPEAWAIVNLIDKVINSQQS
jgi:hypothetical protein